MLRCAHCRARATTCARAWHRPGHLVGADLAQAGRQQRAQAGQEQNGCGEQGRGVAERPEGRNGCLLQVEPAGEEHHGGVAHGDHRQHAAVPDPREYPQARGDGQQCGRAESPQGIQPDPRS